MVKRKQERTIIGDVPDMKVAGADPLQVNARLYLQISELLGQLEAMEGLTIRERVAALVAIGRIQTIFVGLRKEKGLYDGNAGAAVRKYSSAFALKNDTGGRKKIAGPDPRSEPDDNWFERAGILDDDGDDDEDAA